MAGRAQHHRGMNTCITGVSVQRERHIFFTVNLAERRSNLLVWHIDDLRATMRTVKDAHLFGILAMVVYPNTSMRYGVYLLISLVFGITE